MLWLSVLALIGMHGAPDYRRHKLHELVATADQIVVGTIDAVQDTTFDLTVERTLAGEDRPKLHLRRFIDWMCASRYAPYSTGRRVLLFVVDGRPIGGGNEGDWPLVGEGVLVPYSVRGSRYVEREVRVVLRVRICALTGSLRAQCGSAEGEPSTRPAPRS